MHLGIRPAHLSTRGQLLGYVSTWFTMDFAPKLTGRVAAVCGARGRVNIFVCGREKKKKKKKKKQQLQYQVLWHSVLIWAGAYHAVFKHKLPQMSPRDGFTASLLL